MDRRGQILQAAREIAATQGMGEISVRNVAASVGIGASTLRHYFPTQRELFDTVLSEVFDAHLEDLRIHDSSVSPVIRLTECMQQFLPPTDADLPQLEGWLAGYAAAEGPSATNHGSAVLTTFAGQARARVTQWVSLLQHEGALRLTDTQQAASILLATVNGLTLELITPGTPESSESVRQALNQVINGTVINTQADHPRDP